MRPIGSLRKKPLALFLGLLFGSLTIAHAAPGSGAACRDPAAEASLRAKETALLGTAHAKEHAQARAQQCRKLLGSQTAPSPDPQILAAASSLPTSTVGQWSAPIAVPVAGIASVLLNTGNVLFWSYDPTQYLNPSSTNDGKAYIWNPTSPTMGHFVNPPSNIWCGGQTTLADGRVYVAGGNLRYPDPNAPAGTQNWEGALTEYTFNPKTETWMQQPPMSVGRWYPTVTQLADNTVVISSGYDDSGTANVTQIVEQFTPSTDINGVGKIADVTMHDPTGLYPFQYLTATGQLSQFGPSYNNSFMVTPGTWSWSAIPNMNVSHYGYANGVIATDASVTPATQIITIAGGENGTTAISNNEWFDVNNPSAGWRQFPQWLQVRHNSNTVILPDGTLFTVGGSPDPTTYGSTPCPNDPSLTCPNPIYESELYSKPAYDPTGKWVQVAPNTVRAAYHSSAILLPDATVLLSEDDWDYPSGATHYVQVYSPPYLFKGTTRPSITSAPIQVTVGQTFSMTTSTTKIASVVLIAPGAVTHANDMHQRFIKLRSSHGNTSKLTATIPGSHSIVPPGDYLLFIVDSNGVPSLGKFIKVT